MARKFHRREPLGAMSEINVTPLIDLAFALLIIFMITAPLLQQTIDINLPTEQQKPQADSDSQPLMLGINQEGEFYWEKEAVSEEAMAGRLADLANQDPDTVIRVRADSRIPYQRVVDLLDLIKAEKLRKISLETRSE